MKSTNTVNKINEMISERDESSRPVWVRAPRAGGTEFFSGLSRGKMYALEAAGHVRTASLKPKGASRGVKLFLLASLLAYVESCAISPRHPKELDETNKGA